MFELIIGFALGWFLRERKQRHDEMRETIVDALVEFDTLVRRSL